MRHDYPTDGEQENSQQKMMNRKIKILKMKKRLLCILTAAVLVLTCGGLSVWATSLTEVKTEQTATKKKLEEINSSIEKMQTEREKIQSELSSLNEELVETMLTLEVLEMDLENKHLEIEEATKRLEAAKVKEEQQYEAMKLRIRFMYENGDYDYAALLIESKSIADFLNKSELVKEMHRYDRNLLTEYSDTKKQVADWKLVLEEEQDEMLSLQADYEAQKEQLDTQIASAEDEMSDFDSQLANAKAKAKEYRVTIQKQSEKIRELEEEAEAAKNQNTGNETSADNTGSNSGSTSAGNSGNNSGGQNQSGNSGGGSSATVSGSGNGAAIAQYALQFVGNPYVYGGTSLTNGADCSGFTWAVFQHFGISIPRTSVAQSKGGKSVSLSAIQAGDIIYYGHHVGIYLGNGQIVHASTAKTGIKISSYTYRTPICASRYW